MNSFNGNEIIIKGKVQGDTLSLFGLKIGWIMDKLKNYNIESIEEVDYAEIQQNGDLYFEPKIIYCLL